MTSSQFGQEISSEPVVFRPGVESERVFWKLPRLSSDEPQYGHSCIVSLLCANVYR